MKSLMSTLLATDDVARQFGCQLKPELRAAIERDLRFPAYAASPQPDVEHMQGDLPENVVRLPTDHQQKQRSSA